MELGRSKSMPRPCTVEMGDRTDWAETQLDSLVDRSELRYHVLLLESLCFGGDVVPAKSDQESPYVGDLPAESKRTSRVMIMPIYASALFLMHSLVLNRTFDLVITIGLGLPSPQFPASLHNSTGFLRLAAVGRLQSFPVR